MIEKQPETYKAIGVFTGPRSDGLVIFDVDKNLGAIEKKWGKDLKKAPKITSLKKNAAKFLFKVGDHVIFGRPNGRKRPGVILTINPKKALIRDTNLGGKWRVPDSLVEAA